MTTPTQPIMTDPLEPTAADLLANAQPLPSDPPADTPRAAPQPATPPDANPFAGERDKLGREFHPAKFRLKDGKPQLDTLGRFVPLGAGAPKKSAASSENGDSGSRLPPADEAHAEVIPEISAEVSVDVAIGLVQAALIMIGEDEGVLSEIEVKMLRGPFLRIIEKYNVKSQMTPELEVMSCIAVVILRRLKKPKTQSWFQRQLQWVVGWWRARKIEKLAPEPMPTT